MCFNKSVATINVMLKILDVGARFGSWAQMVEGFMPKEFNTMNL